MTPYCGEFLISPCAIEISGNHCSHNCPYCFANLNSPGAIFEEKKVIRAIEQCDRRTSLHSYLLAQKYPVLISNRSDPFAHSNYKAFVPLIRLLTEKGIPVSIQTRGGEGIDEVLNFLPPSVWYLSIPYQNDDLRQQIERYAPSIGSRFNLIEKLRLHGHRILIGVNPLVREWVPNPKILLSDLQRAGAEGVWIEPLHLSSHSQRDNMLKRDRQILGEDLLRRSRKRKMDEGDRDHLMKAFVAAAELGLPSFSIGQPLHSDFFRPFREIYPKTLPTTQDWVNHVLEHRIQSFGYEDWFNFFAPRLPQGITSRQMYLYLYPTLRFNRSKCNQALAAIGKPETYGELLKAIWDGQEYSPQTSLFLGSALFEKQGDRVAVINFED